jgi:hypothetical protein
MRSVERLAFCVLACAAMSGCAGGKYEPPKDRYNTIDTGGQVFAPEEAWKEGEVTIPSYPQVADLLPFDVSGPADNAYFLDARSISIGADGVVRYTLLARLPAGVENVTYEGIRCEERQWKPYAFGRRDGTWAPARDATWQPVTQKSVDDFRFSLYRDYLCRKGLPPRKAEEAVAEIRRQYRAGPLHEGR